MPRGVVAMSTVVWRLRGGVGLVDGCDGGCCKE
jgi:hypothetical protein